MTANIRPYIKKTARRLSGGTMILILLSLILAPLAGSCRGTEVTEMKEYAIPPIDANRPAATETATFALG